MNCRHCGNTLTNTFVDLGSSPPSNSYLTEKGLNEPEKWYPLKVMVCDKCWLVQTEDIVGFGEMFSNEYAYFSSFSTSWLTHAQTYVADMTKRFNLSENSNVVEIAANDGYLLQYVKERKIPCYGIEPTHGTAVAARKKGLKIVEDFFGTKLAKELATQNRQADLMVANNVLAHVPDINDFLQGFAALLKPNGVATFEFPHLLNLIEKTQFDTIYHEHFSYLSLTAIEPILKENGLIIFDCEELGTHGGSLRVFAQRTDLGRHTRSLRANDLLQKELAIGMKNIELYGDFQLKSEHIKNELTNFLLMAKNEGSQVIGYGAAAKGSTMLNFAGLRSDLINAIVDLNPNKVGKYMPGCRIPILDEAIISEQKPKYVLILPWNLRNEVESQLSYIREWGGKFVTAIPELVIW